MDRLTILRTTGFACSLPMCICSQELAESLTDDQVRIIETSAPQGDNSKNVATFLATLSAPQRSILARIANATLVTQETVVIMSPHIHHDDEEAETPEQLRLNIARVAAEQRTRA